MLPDYLPLRSRVLFVGINPGMRSAALGHHYAGPGNRFWDLVGSSGLVPEPLTYADDHRMPEWGYGLTNLVARATPGVADLTAAELRQGARALLGTIARTRPAIVAPVGVTVWRAILDALDVPGARSVRIRHGFQSRRLGDARVFVLPNPSGRNAHLDRTGMLRLFRRLAGAISS
ncbi:MAG: mismatch-specific DNA-glycosylase [Vicinamibacterales bacterium]